MLDKDNPLQMGMIDNGVSEKGVLEYYRDYHKKCIEDSNKDLESDEERSNAVLEVIKRHNSFHKEKFEEYQNKLDTVCEGGENGS